MSAVVRSNWWAQDLYRFPSPYDYRIVHGGRGSSKTFEITRALIAHGHQRPLRICVAREHRVAITESAFPELVSRITELGLMHPNAFRKTVNSIDHVNGTHIFFIGMSVVSEEDIKGLAYVDILWVEEAHQMSHSSWERIYPTIRKDNSEIWLSFNPRYRNDVAWKLLSTYRNDPSVWIKQVNWRDNAYFTDRNDRDRLRDKKINPSRYPHIWEGQPDDVAAEQKVLPYALLQICVDAWEKRPQPRGAFGAAGFDVADTGDDRNCELNRWGPEVDFAELWHGTQEYTISHSTRRVCDHMQRRGIDQLNYDAGGPGSGVRGPLNEWMQRHSRLNARGWHNNAAVQRPERIYSRPPVVTNAQKFSRWGDQAAWNLRMRADRTERLMVGDQVDTGQCLFIDPSIPNLEDLLAEFAQPEWNDATGKLRVDKRPRAPGESLPPSPDGFDALRLAFASDTRAGLRDRG